MANEKNNPDNFPPATIRTLEILDYFANDPAPKTLKEISIDLDIPFSSVYRIISCMQEYRYIVEAPGLSNHFKLGYKVSKFGDIAFTENDLIRLTSPVMDRISNQSNQACQLATLVETGVSNIEQKVPRSVITYISELGEVLPLNTNASGKILAALLPEKEQEAFLKRVCKYFTSNTEYTITDIEEFKNELIRTKHQGYGTDVEEYALGIGCIAVPIYGPHKIPIAAICLTGPIDDYQTQAQLNTKLELLTRASAEITQLIT